LLNNSNEYFPKNRNILDGIGMFLFGIHMFAYAGPPVSQFVSDLGMYSFSFWLPILRMGVVYAS